MKRIPLLALSLLLTACGTNLFLPATAKKTSEITLNVFAAASLTDAFRELAERFEAENPQITVALNFAGSNTLRTQIEQGARVDVFASANAREMEILKAQGLVDSSRPFAENRLVVVTPASNPGAVSSFADLARPGLTLVLAAEEVPVGGYSRLVLDKVGESFKKKTLANLVSNENSVRQVLAKIQLGEADAGMVYASDASAASNVSVVEIPAKFNIQALYPIASPTGAPHPEAAQSFIDFLLSEEGQKILAQWGLLPVSDRNR